MQRLYGLGGRLQTGLKKKIRDISEVRETERKRRRRGPDREGVMHMRLFVAIQLSDEIRASITETMHGLKKAGVKGSYVPTNNLHLTLAFIGETRDTAAVKAALQTVSFKPFHLALSEMGTFGDLLWVGLKGGQGLNGAAREVRRALDEAGIAYDTKKFVPHITMIRGMTGNWKPVPAPGGKMMVKKISLMKSEVKDGKRRYTEVDFGGKS